MISECMKLIYSQNSTRCKRFYFASDIGKLDWRKAKYLLVFILLIALFRVNFSYLSPINQSKRRVPLAINEAEKENTYLKDRAAMWMYEDKVSEPIRNKHNWTKLREDVEHIPLLTLFTTFKVDQSHDQMNRNTLKLWTWLPKCVRPVLFYSPDDNVTFIDYALSLGWLSYPVPGVREKYPIVRDMFLFAINEINPPSLFYGFANSDIVFANNLAETLQSLSELNWFEVDGQGMLIIGKRYDVPIEKVTKSAMSNKPTPLRDLAKGQVLGNDLHLDYFISTADGYPFQKIPAFVVGKPGYDNWLVAKAMDWQIRTIDATETITTLHQSSVPIDSEVRLEGGWFSMATCLNYELSGVFDAERGGVDCTIHVTKKSRSGTFSLQKRTKFGEKCFRPPRGHKIHCEKVVARKSESLAQRINAKNASVSEET